MEFFLTCLSAIFGLLIVAGGIAGIVGFIRAERMTKEIKALESRLVLQGKTLYQLHRRLEEAGQISHQEPLSEQTPPEVVVQAKIETQPVASFEVCEQKPTEPKTPPVAGPITPPIRPDDKNWEWIEQNIGKRWMTWAGAAVLFLATAFFIKYAFDNNWLGPVARVSIGVFFGIMLLLGGDRFIRHNMRSLGQGLLGGGLAVLYLSIFAALSFYQLIPHLAAFLMMVVITVLGISLAIMHDSIVVSFLAVLGGMLTPVLVSSGQNQRDGLFTYLLLLDLGVFGAAFFKKWRALDILAFIGTLVLFTGWYGQFYEAKYVPGTMLWLSAFFLVFLALPFVYHFRQKAAISVERFVASLINATFFFGFAYDMLMQDYQHTLGFIVLGMAAAYITLGVITRRSLPDDKRSLFGFVTLSVALLTLAIPLHLKMYGITMLWAIEGPVLVYLGYRFRYTPTRIFGAAVLVLAIGRLFIFHWPLHLALFTPVFNVNFASALFIPLVIAIYSYIHLRFQKQGTELDEALRPVSGVIAGLLAIFLFSREFHEWLVYLDRNYLTYFSTTVIWALGAAIFFVVGITIPSSASRYAALFPLGTSLVFGLFYYHLTLPSGSLMFANMRFAAALTAIIMLTAYALVTHRLKERISSDNSLVIAVFAVGLVYLLIILSIEVFSYIQATVIDPNKAKWSSLMALSMVWGIYAVLALATGFWKRWRSLRLAALAWLGITLVKLVLIDMANIGQIYRIIAFVVLGLILIGASYLYHVLEKRLEPLSAKEQSQ